MTENQQRGFSKLHGVTKPTRTSLTLNADTVWIDNNLESGVLSKGTFIAFLKELRVEDYEHTESLFRFLRERRSFSNSLKKRTDRGGNSYYWANFPKPRGNDGVKIMDNVELLTLVQNYIDGKVNIDFDMDELIDEGLRQG